MVIFALASLGGCIETAEAQPARRADGGARVTARPPTTRERAVALREANLSLIRALSAISDAGPMNVLGGSGSFQPLQGGIGGLALRRDGGVVAPIGALRAPQGLIGTRGGGLGGLSGIGGLGGRSSGLGGLGTRAGQPLFARFDDLSVAGQTPVDAVREALARVSPFAQACLTAAGRRMPTDVAVRFTLRSTGRVADVTVRSAPDLVERCVQSGLRSLLVRGAREGSEVSAWFRYRAPGSVEAGRH